MVYSVGGVGTNYGKGYSLPKPDIHHHRKADDLRAGFEIAKWGAFCHPLSLRNHPTLLKQSCSDKTSRSLSQLRDGQFALYQPPSARRS